MNFVVLGTLRSNELAPRTIGIIHEDEKIAEGICIRKRVVLRRCVIEPKGLLIYIAVKVKPLNRDA